MRGWISFFQGLKRGSAGQAVYDFSCATRFFASFGLAHGVRGAVQFPAGRVHGFPSLKSGLRQIPAESVS